MVQKISVANLFFFKLLTETYVEKIKMKIEGEKLKRGSKKVKIASKPGSKDSLRFFENFPRALITAFNVRPYKMILDTFTRFCRNIYTI